jgi:hypothetical protein
LQVIAISARPGSRRHGVVLEAVPAKGRSTQLWSPKPASGLPTEFADAAERVRIETAIRLAAEQLDKEKIAQVRYTKEHDDAVAREHKDEMEAKALHAKAVSLAQKAIEQRTTFHVEQDRAATANKEISLEKRIASLMASKSEALKSQAEQSVRVAHEAGTGICLCVCVCPCMYMRSCVCVCIRVRVCMCMCIHMHSVCVYVCACVCVCVYICIRWWRMKLALVCERVRM